MTDPTFDGLARALARPMPRRQAVRVMAAGLAAASFPSLWPRRAAAQTFCGPSLHTPETCGECTAGGPCCPWPSGGAVSCCRPDQTCDGQGRCCVPCPEGTTECGPPGEAQCCASGEECADGECVAGCGSGRVRCGGNCCEKDEECIEGRCLPKCPPKRTRCRDQCCPAGERCVNGKCRECPEDRKACGKKCCGKGEDCCFDETRKICCDTNRRECCSVGEPDQEQITCCPERTRCTRQIVQGQSGLTEDSPTVCCPPRRHVPLGGGRGACCPPGYTSMGGKVVVTACPGDPTQGLCCRDELTCGSGKAITCCCPGQTCVEGSCA